MPKVLVTGASGQLGSEIKDISNGYEFEFKFATKEELDITNYEKLNAFIKENNIDSIINCAAYTAVDKAEDEIELAFSINANAVKNLANVAKDNNVKLVHISTDYVFDGLSAVPYSEDDKTNPQNVYGKSKLAGENEMLSINPKNSIIIRTSWVYSSFGSNFVKTMLRLGKEKSELSVIWDQIGSPTYARDLARFILEILPQLNSDKTRIYHFSNEGVLSWFDFAKEIMKMAKLPCQIKAIKSQEYIAKAKRPHMSLLDKSKIKVDFKYQVSYWKDSLDECLRMLGERK